MALAFTVPALRHQRSYRPSFAATALWTCLVALVAEALPAAAQPEDEKPVKVSVKAAANLDNAVKDNLLDMQIVQIMLKEIAVAKETVTLTIDGGKLGKSFNLPNKTSVGLVVQPSKKGPTISKLVFRTKVQMILTEPLEVEEVQLGEGTPLERTPDGNWWVKSKEVREKLLAREKARLEDEAQKKKLAAAAPDDEDAASKKLKDVKDLVAGGNVALARIRCQAIIDTHGRTKSAEEARQLLAKLKKK